MLPVAPDELIPLTEPIASVAPALKVKTPGPLIMPVLVIVKVPSQRKVAWPAVITTVPPMVPEAVEASVKFNRVAGAPRVKVFPARTAKPLVTVRSETPAANVQVPLTVRLDRAIPGTAVMLADWSAGIVTSSPAAGAPAGLQLEAVVQAPPVVGTHDFEAALAVA